MPKIIEPIPMKCSVCNWNKYNGEYCKENPIHPDYDDVDGDIYDCADFLDWMNGKPKGSWMLGWIKNIQKKQKDRFRLE